MFSYSVPEPTSPPSKAELTRERILQSALILFRTNGYENTTLRQIAAESGSSLGLAYRYFGGKEEFVLAFYETLAVEFIEQISTLPQGKIASRFTAAFNLKLALVEPHNELIGVLLSAALNPNSRIAVLGQASAEIRTRMQTAFIRLVSESEDAPDAATCAAFGKLLYVVHLALLYFRVNDRTPGGRATRELLAWIETALSYFPMSYRLPFVSDALLKLSATLETVFGGATDEHPAQ
ncbi:MAG TPA: TetR/AcrR family transcriptional regulator [Candidatus Acidoferrum sp.]|nr:TetR/AcrR family transcriptional regulator [Candidatus Acidoferrum sp.]